MSELVWLVIPCILFIVLGLVFLLLAWFIAIKQKINLIISYHHEKVNEENKKSYCMICGIATAATGIGFIVSGIMIIFIQTIWTFIPMTVGIIIGLGLFLAAGFVYNR